jgi:NADH dehydrogenase FAD-containing subunit
LSVIRPPDGLHRLKKNRNTQLNLTDEKKGVDQNKLLVDEEDEKEGLPIDTIFGRTLDTLEDAFRVASRLPVEKGWVERPPLEESCPDLVVLGSGWAAHALLKIVDTTKTRLTVISPSNHFVFTPMLASASVGTVEYRSMTESVRAANPSVKFIEGSATDIDIEKQTVAVNLVKFSSDKEEEISSPIVISYDKLVVAVGCKIADNLVPGAAEHCMRLKSCDDSRQLRTAIGESLEYASRPDVLDDSTLSDSERQRRRDERRKRATFCIIGGGPTGVEFAGELSDFLRYATRDRVGVFQNLKNDYRIVVVEGMDKLLPPFDPALRDHALNSLRNAGVEVKLNTFTTKVEKDHVSLAPKGSDIEEKLEFGVCLWAAGTAPVPLVQTLLDKLPEEARARGNRINVDQWMRCPTPSPESFGSILVLGDAAAFPTKSAVLPQTAQVAGQQGAYAARLICRGYDLSATPPVLKPDVDFARATWLKLRGLNEAEAFKFLNLGLLAYVGSGEALTQIEIGDVPIASYAGSTSFVLWRSVYLVKQVATRNRVLILFDWMKRVLFGYDITRL